MSLENYLKNQIPFGEACAFLVEFRKLGSEMEGVVPPTPDTLGLYAAVAQAEFKSILAYITYGQTLHGLERNGLAEEFEDHVDEELEHVEFVLRRMAVLGGAPPLPEVPAPPPAADAAQVIQNLVQIEQEGIAAWQALHAALGDDPARFKVEEYLAVEQEHLDDLLRFMPAQPAVESQAPMAAGPPGTSVKVDLKPGEEKVAFAERLLPGTENYYSDRMLAVLQGLPPKVFTPMSGGEEKVAGALHRAANKMRAAGANLVGHLTGSNVKRLKDARADMQSLGMKETPELNRRIVRAGFNRDLVRVNAGLLGVYGGTMGAAAIHEKLKDKKQGKVKNAAAPLEGSGGMPVQADPNVSAFMQSEMEGQAAQEQNEIDYYKQRFAEAQQQLEAATQASEQAAAQAQQLQQQVEQNQLALSSVQNQSQQATSMAMQQVMQAGDSALQQQQQAAQMRMAFQELRGQLLNLASQEPPTQVLNDPAAQMGDATGQATGQAPGQAVQAQPPQPPQEGTVPPTDASAPGGQAAPEGAAPAEAESKGKGGTSVTVKQGSRAFGAGVGALLGGAGTAFEASGHGDGLRENLKKKISVLEQDQGSFRQAMKLVASKSLLGGSEAAAAHPGGATILGSLVGAGIGAATEPAVRSWVESGRRLRG